jgi:hypothetical protein
MIVSEGIRWEGEEGFSAIWFGYVCGQFYGLL